MGSSFVDLGGKVSDNLVGFWARDWAIEALEKLLYEESESLQATYPWLNEVRQHWKLYSEAGFMGCNDILPYDFEINDEKRGVFLSVVGHVIEGMKLSDANEDELICARRFESLLKGTWRKTVSSPLDYMRTGETYQE